MQAWTQAQNALTGRVLDAVPGRDTIRARVAELLGVGWLMPPVVRRGRYFYTRREGAEDQLILRWRSADGVDRVLIDPVAQTGVASTAIDWWFPSPDGRLVAYGLSRGGDEQSTLRVRRVDDGKDLAEEIPRTRLCSLAWLPDASSFYYTRYPLPGSVPAGDEEYGRHAFLHRIGTDWHRDPDVFGEGRPKEHMAWLGISPDGRWLWVGSWRSSSRNDLYLLDRAAPERGFVTIMEDVDARAVPDAQPDALWVFTNLGAPRYRICRIDPARPQPENWTEVVPEGPDTIQNAGVVGGHLGCALLRDATSVLRLYRFDGTPVRELALPGPGTVYYWTGEADQDEIFIGYQSFIQPPTVYRHVVSTGEQTVWAQVDSPVDPAKLEIRQVWFASKDGTRVPMFIVHRTGLPRDGERPTLLYGYGGFNIPQTPFFLRGARVLLDRDGVYAMANLRGGGEYGEAWHQAGMLERKQNVFDDCIAAAEWLVAEGYTQPARLAVNGASNGGLLVGAMVTQRPDLFRAAVSQVPLIDMLRYHRFDWARSWATEYGSSDDPEQLRYLLAYSPYHRVDDDGRYPAVLITAGAADSRCDPLHARKFAARLQAANAAATPILLRVDTGAGHGIGKPLSTWIEEATDVWCFLATELELGR